MIITFICVGAVALTYGLARQSCGFAVIGISFLFSAALGLLL